MHQGTPERAAPLLLRVLCLLYRHGTALRTRGGGGAPRLAAVALVPPELWSAVTPQLLAAVAGGGDDSVRPPEVAAALGAALRGLATAASAAVLFPALVEVTRCEAGVFSKRMLSALCGCRQTRFAAVCLPARPALLLVFGNWRAILSVELLMGLGAVQTCPSACPSVGPGSVRLSVSFSVRPPVRPSLDRRLQRRRRLPAFQ
jgi:hypothetical protein